MTTRTSRPFCRTPRWPHQLYAKLDLTSATYLPTCLPLASELKYFAAAWRSRGKLKRNTLHVVFRTPNATQRATHTTPIMSSPAAAAAPRAPQRLTLEEKVWMDRRRKDIEYCSGVGGALGAAVTAGITGRVQ
ncbi:hypothetical protein ON010_g11726 [Phytophthora cinnamomi]|nr:hypothetical protein ON010_g11726 [Phytophthora cinnamomi]